MHLLLFLGLGADKSSEQFKTAECKGLTVFS